MGGSSSPKVVDQVDQKSHGYEAMIQQIMQGFLSGQNTPQVNPNVQAPDTPLHQQAMMQAQQSTGAHGADMEKFFGGMMGGGGLANLQNIERSAAQQGQMDDQNVMAQMAASGVPMNSTAMARGMSGALANNATQRNMGLSQMQLGNQQMGMQNQFAGAQGLGSMPSYYAQPSSIEAQMMGLRLPYDMASNQNQQLNAQFQQAQQGMGANLAGGFLNNNWYMPDTIVDPGQQGMDPMSLAGPAMMAAAMAFSDGNYKEAVQPLGDTGAILDQLRGVRYKWRPSARFFGTTYEGDAAGMIAQEVEAAMPEAVITANGTKMIRYDAIVGLLIEEVKTLRSRLTALEGGS